MVYAMFSIGILGFIVWSLLVGSFNFLTELDYQIIIETICKNVLNYLNNFDWFNQSFSFLNTLINEFADYPLSLSETVASEIIRSNLFTFPFLNDLTILNDINLSKISPEWLQWFIGFTEGDGSLFVSKDRLYFVITQNELSVLEMIQNTLNFGNISWDEGSNCWRFRVEDLDSIFKLATIFNGNFFLDHRIEQLNAWIEVLNLKGYYLNFIADRVSISLFDGWLSGFTDAEGCFNVTIGVRAAMALGFRVLLRFILDQNDKAALTFIQNLFGFGGVNFRSETSACWRYETSALKQIPVVINYFNKFPLKTKKSESFRKWCEVYSMMLEKKHLTAEGLNTIRELAKKNQLR